MEDLTEITPGIRVRPFTPHPLLGRNQQLDARSLVGARLVENAPERLGRRLRSVHWSRRLPILDQGALGPWLTQLGQEGEALGCCVAMSYVGALGCDLYGDRLPEVLGVDWASSQLASAATSFAILRYSALTAQDPFAGQWPTEDTGTDGLTACKVARAAGEISAYRHARTLRGLVSLLQDGPVLMGMPWFAAFFEPGRDHRIDPVGWADSPEMGGHEVVVVGVELHRGSDDELDRAVFTFANSWSTAWGDDGFGRLGGRTYELLRAGVDLRQFSV